MKTKSLNKKRGINLIVLVKTIEEELTLKQTSEYIDKHTGKKTSEITIADLSSAESYMKANKFLVKGGKLGYIIGSVTDLEKN